MIFSQPFLKCCLVLKIILCVRIKGHFRWELVEHLWTLFQCAICFFFQLEKWLESLPEKKEGEEELCSNDRESEGTGATATAAAAGIKPLEAMLQNNGQCLLAVAVRCAFLYSSIIV